MRSFVIVLALSACGSIPEARFACDVLTNSTGNERHTNLDVDASGTSYAVGMATEVFKLPGEGVPPSGLAPAHGFIVSYDRGGRLRWAERVAASAGSASLAAVDVVDRSTATRAIVVVGTYSGTLVHPVGVAGLPTAPADFGLVVVLTE